MDVVGCCSMDELPLGSARVQCGFDCHLHLWELSSLLALAT